MSSETGLYYVLNKENELVGVADSYITGYIDLKGHQVGTDFIQDSYSLKPVRMDEIRRVIDEDNTLYIVLHKNFYFGHWNVYNGNAPYPWGRSERYTTDVIQKALLYREDAPTIPSCLYYVYDKDTNFVGFVSSRDEPARYTDLDGVTKDFLKRYTIHPVNKKDLINVASKFTSNKTEEYVLITELDRSLVEGESVFRTKGYKLLENGNFTPSVSRVGSVSKVSSNEYGVKFDYPDLVKSYENCKDLYVLKEHTVTTTTR